MALKIYNTETRRKELFHPLRDAQVRMYVCGPTVYDHAHMGHARSYIAFDVVRRYLEFLGYHVIHVMNFTDIEQVISERAAEAGVPPLDYASKFIESFKEDMERLHIKSPTYIPRVSDHIPEIIEAIKGLVERGWAYVIGGEVYFRFSKSNKVGSLSHRKPEDLTTEPIVARVQKENPMDFAIWKKSKQNEPSWDSPWGPGRPGWHIECYALASKYLGTPLDLHGGGVDLIFPHHESENMMGDALNNHPLSALWMHNGFILIKQEKMSKSLGNFIRVRDVLAEWDGDVVRLCMLEEHYRKDVEYDQDCFRRTKEEYDEILSAVKRALDGGGEEESGGAVEALAARARRKLVESMDDDFDVGSAIYTLTQFSQAILGLKHFSHGESQMLVSTLKDFSSILGLFEDVLAPR